MSSLARSVDKITDDFEKMFVKPLKLRWSKPVTEVWDFTKKHKKMIIFLALAYALFTYLFSEESEQEYEDE